jgi:hypothetical protein
VNRRERRRLYRVGRVVGKFIRAHQIRRQPVFMNVPPAMVRHMRLKPTSLDGGWRVAETGTERSLQAHSRRTLSILL